MMKLLAILLLVSNISKGFSTIISLDNITKDEVNAFLDDFLARIGRTYNRLINNYEISKIRYRISDTVFREQDKLWDLKNRTLDGVCELRQKVQSPYYDYNKLQVRTCVWPLYGYLHPLYHLITKLSDYEENQVIQNLEYLRKFLLTEKRYLQICHNCTIEVYRGADEKINDNWAYINQEVSEQMSFLTGKESALNNSLSHYAEERAALETRSKSIIWHVNECLTNLSANPLRKLKYFWLPYDKLPAGYFQCFGVDQLPEDPQERSRRIIKRLNAVMYAVHT